MAAAHQPHTVRSASLLRQTAESQRMAQSNCRRRSHIASVAQSSLPLLLGVGRPDAFRTGGKQVRVVLVFGAQLLVECVLWDHCGVRSEAGKTAAGVERLVNVETIVRRQTVGPTALLAVLAVCCLCPSGRRLRKRFGERALVLDERMAVEVADLMLVRSGHVDEGVLCR